MSNASYKRVLSNPSASAGGRSSRFANTRTAAERAVTNSVARICIVRGGPTSIPLLLTPGLGRVVTTAVIFVPKFPPDRNCPELVLFGMRSIGHAYVPLSLPHTLEQLSFLNEILIGPDL